ncbi:MAG: carbohydrate ABC transporter permease [Planctomycetota bacterium]
MATASSQHPGVRLFKKVAIYGPLTVFAIVTLVPFAYLIASAFKTKDAFFSSPFLPMQRDAEGNAAPWYALHQIDWSGLTLNNFASLFGSSGHFAQGIVNSIFFASASAIVATIGSAMGGYALAKFKWKGRGFATNVVLASLVVPGALLLAPGYQVLYQLGLLDSYAGLILPMAAPAFGVFLFRQSIVQAVPNELLEAGRMDGCGEIRLFTIVVLPLVKPMVGAFVLITFLGSWNNFIGPQIVLQSPEKQPLAVQVSQLSGVYETAYGPIMAGTVLAVAPILILFLMLQRDFIAGLTSGAVKG